MNKMRHIEREHKNMMAVKFFSFRCFTGKNNINSLYSAPLRRCQGTNSVLACGRFRSLRSDRSVRHHPRRVPQLRDTHSRQVTAIDIVTRN